ncbi:VrrA/YqfQ family protein [Rossellomorea aquimaris]|uniref:VrrA/YqfQ family protein n=1 Tax=Rossellomorea aquimaris TaxID=189382 RepID=UPI0007D043F7|nr:VrrA/YqfQ family protein [Rossellomorea aquimaris]
MPPRRMRNGHQQMRNPFGMRPVEIQQNPFGMPQPQQQMRNPFGMRQHQSPPFQMGRQQPNRGINFNGGNRSRGKGRGGLLSKLLKKGDSNNQTGGILQQFTRDASGSTGFDRAPQAGGSIIGSLLNPGNVNSFLSNTQQVLQSAQQLGPIFQQYGPMVKNLPALWRLYRGFKDLSSEDNSEENTLDSTEEISKAGEERPKKKKRKKTSNENKEESSDHIGNSKPKLYI